MTKLQQSKYAEHMPEEEVTPPALQSHGGSNASQAERAASARGERENLSLYGDATREVTLSKENPQLPFSLEGSPSDAVVTTEVLAVRGADSARLIARDDSGDPIFQTSVSAGVTDVHNTGAISGGLSIGALLESGVEVDVRVNVRPVNGAASSDAEDGLSPSLVAGVSPDPELRSTGERAEFNLDGWDEREAKANENSDDYITSKNFVFRVETGRGEYLTVALRVFQGECQVLVESRDHGTYSSPVIFPLTTMEEGHFVGQYTGSAEHIDFDMTFDPEAGAAEGWFSYTADGEQLAGEVRHGERFSLDELFSF